MYDFKHRQGSIIKICRALITSVSLPCYDKYTWSLGVSGQSAAVPRSRNNSDWQLIHPNSPVENVREVA